MHTGYPDLVAVRVLSSSREDDRLNTVPASAISSDRWKCSDEQVESGEKGR